jgi:hypothetical protein
MDKEKTPAEQLYSKAIVEGAMGAMEGIKNPSAAIPYEKVEVEMLRKALGLGLPLDKQISSHMMIGNTLFSIGRAYQRDGFRGLPFGPTKPIRN